MIRQATYDDIDAVSKIYDEIHANEEQGLSTVGWIKGVYPTEETARNAIACGELFVEVQNGAVVGAAIINQKQVDAYEKGNWIYPAKDNEVMVLHTLVISPSQAEKGYGKKFIEFYEQYALSKGCHYLRIDTNARNSKARAMYEKLGFSERGIIPTTFNGISGIDLVLLEKRI